MTFNFIRKANFQFQLLFAETIPAILKQMNVISTHSIFFCVKIILIFGKR